MDGWQVTKKQKAHVLIPVLFYLGLESCIARNIKRTALPSHIQSKEKALAGSMSQDPIQDFGNRKARYRISCQASGICGRNRPWLLVLVLLLSLQKTVGDWSPRCMLLVVLDLLGFSHYHVHSIFFLVE